MVKREDVVRFLKTLDVHNVPNRDTDGNIVAGKSVELRKEYLQIFLDMFSDVDLQVWETAARLVLKRKKPWPTPDEMMDYISKVDAAYREKQKTAPVETEPRAPVPQSVPETAGRRERKQQLQEMLALAKQGRFKEAGTLIAANDYCQEAIEYGKLYFPDVDAKWYEENINLLRALASQQEDCNHCQSTFGCKTKGYRWAGIVDKSTGMLSITMVPCTVKKMESAENVSI